MSKSKQFGAFNRFVVRIQEQTGGRAVKTESYTVLTAQTFEDIQSFLERTLADEYGAPGELVQSVPEPEVITMKPVVRRKKA